jgi:hypothetical protein
LAISVAMTWPLVRDLRGDIAKDLGDPLLEAWQVAWIGHAVLHQPLHLFQANIFWPLRDSLAFTDALVGYAPAGLVAQTSPQAAIAVYNLLFLFAYALAFLGAYLLARELGTGRLGGIVAGAAFAYAPWRLPQNSHLHVISSGGIPLALFLLVRGYRRGSPWLVFAGWLVAAWQLTLGFTLGLQLVYLLGILGFLAAAGLAAKRLPWPPRAVTIATLAGVLVVTGVAALQARPYLRVVDEHPEARRTEKDVLSFSPPLRSFLAAPAESFLWNEPSARARAPLPAPGEQVLFPGLTIGLLAAVGLAGSAFSRRLRIGLGVAVVVCGALSLGLREGSGWHRYVTPYRLLFELAPGWNGVRTPGRINTLTSLGLALLAGAGMCVVARAARRAASSGRLRRIAVPAVATSLVLGILVEGLGPLPHPEVPPVSAAARRAEPPVLHLPWTEDHTYTYWSTAGFPRTVNGIGGFGPDLMHRLRGVVRGFPDERSVTALRRLGVRTVLLHRGLAPGTAWSRAGRRSIRGLPLERRDTKEAIVYVLAQPTVGIAAP